MANKGFGARELTLLSGGTPTISVPSQLDINATEVGISTGLTVGGATTISNTLNVTGTADFSGRINASELNAEVYFQESDDANKTCNIPFMTADQSGNSFAFLEVDDNVLTFNPGTNYLRTTNLTVAGDIDVTGDYSGDGSGLSNIVTSLVAGSGISINNTTGAITITNSSQGVGPNDSLNTTGIITASAFDSSGTGDPVIRVGSGTTLKLEAPIVAITTNLTVGGTATLGTLEATIPNLPTIYAGAGSTISLAANNVAISTNCSVGGDLTVAANIGLTGNINGTDGTINVNTNVINFFNGPGSTKYFELNHTTGFAGFSTGLSAPLYKTSTTVGDGSDKSYGITYSISANSGNYRFAGPGLTNATDNPTLRLHRGQTYIFENSTGSSHPFQIRYTAGGTGYGSTYISGSTTGTQTFVVPYDAPTHLVYQCTSHPGMVGDIYVDYAPEYIPFGFIKEGVNITSGKLSDNTDIDLDNNLFSFFTTQETTTSTPNLRWNSQTTLDSKMEVGESISVSIMNTASAAGFSTALSIDGSAATIKWFNGVVPAQGGTGNDVYNYTVIKTGSSAFTVLANLSSYV